MLRHPSRKTGGKCSGRRGLFAAMDLHFEVEANVVGRLPVENVFKKRNRFTGERLIPP